MSENNSYKPDWAPENAGQEFAVRVVKGKEKRESGPQKNAIKKRKQLSPEEFVNGILAGDRNILARAITLIESNSPNHYTLARNVLDGVFQHSGKSVRIGITGVPGAGKSTLIEALGMYLLKEGHKVAVLTVDPSSSVTRGSILGDKTRMEKLSREENCFIRPSPSGGTLGGVARKSRETMLLCEAAGYDTILIETVGVGQSEITVRSMVDFFLLVLIPGGGDELQGIKRGVMELADAVLINKADGDNEKPANIAKADYTNALHYMKPYTRGWHPKAHTASALHNKGIDDLWSVITEFTGHTKSEGIFEEQRKDQAVEWMLKLIEDELRGRFYNHPEIKNFLPGMREDIINEKKLPAAAAEELLEIFFKSGGDL